MKAATVLMVSLFLYGCSDGQIEEFAFRKTLEHDLVELCGKEDQGCISAVKTLVEPCMERSSWRKYLDNQDSDAELKRFTGELFSCIVSPDGKPYFSRK